MHPYLDDWLIRAKSEVESCIATCQVVDFLWCLGWVVNMAKNKLEPSQDFVYLGACFDMGAGLVCLPSDRVKKIQEQVKRFLRMATPSAWHYLQLLGSLVASLELVLWARAHLWPLQQALLSWWSPQWQVVCPLKSVRLC